MRFLSNSKLLLSYESHKTFLFSEIPCTPNKLCSSLQKRENFKETVFRFSSLQKRENFEETVFRF